MATKYRMARKYYLACEDKNENAFESVQIRDCSDAFAYAKNFYKDDIKIYESLFIILLDKGMKVKGWAKISQGGIDMTVVDMKIVAKYVVDSLAAGCILVHNHPSGRLTPSDQDKDFTRKAKKVLKLFNSSLIDSLVISDTNYESINDYI